MKKEQKLSAKEKSREENREQKRSYRNGWNLSDTMNNARILSVTTVVHDEYTELSCIKWPTTVRSYISTWERYSKTKNAKFRTPYHIK